MNNRHIIAYYIGEYATQLGVEAKNEKIENVTLSNLIKNLIKELNLISFGISFNTNCDNLKEKMSKASEYCESLKSFGGYQPIVEKVINIFSIYQKEADSIPDAKKIHEENSAKIKKFNEQSANFFANREKK